VFAVGGAVPAPPRLTVAVCAPWLKGYRVRITSVLPKRGEYHLERRHDLKQVVADDFLTSIGARRDSDNAGSSGPLVRGDTDSDPRPVAVSLSGRRGW
jgi:hypothetical protein